MELVSRARPFTNREGRKESGQIQHMILLCTVSNLRKEGRDYDVLLYITNFRKICVPDFLAPHEYDYRLEAAIQESEEAWKQLSGQKVLEIFPVQLLQVPGAVLWLMHTLDHAAFSFSYDHYQRDLSDFCTSSSWLT